uniref:Ras related GTP binding C n=1 Tax=Laticauda laticaudata TaxID=8630 RepID=A0A8C5S4D6_LATLA
MAAMPFGAAGAAEEPAQPSGSALPAGSLGAADAFPKDFGYGADEDEAGEEDGAELAGGGGGLGLAGPGGGGGGGVLGPGGGDSSKQPRILLMGLRRSGKSSIQKVPGAAGAAGGRAGGRGRRGPRPEPPVCCAPGRWSSTRCPPTRRSSWRAPPRSTRTTSPAAPSSTSRSGTSPARWTSSTPPSTTSSSSEAPGRSSTSLTRRWARSAPCGGTAGGADGATEGLGLLRPGPGRTKGPELRWGVPGRPKVGPGEAGRNGSAPSLLQDDYMEALTRLHITVSKAYKINPEMNFEVFIHKVDGLSDDHKIETQRDIHQRANDDLADAGLEKLHLSFYLTSIYDHSIFEAFSKVVQKLIPQLPTLENLLNIFISNSGIEKAFLFDVVSKIYIATDSSPVDMQSYELCCDMIDVVIDVSCIYGLKEDGSGSAYDEESMAIIKLNNTTVLYLKEVTKFLALVCILREESFERKGLIDYNFHCFRKAIHEVFEVGLSSHRSCGHQANIPNLKAVTHNGTPKED